MKRKLYHLHILATDEHKYYGSLQAIFDDKNDVGVSKFTLDRYDWKEPYRNEKVIIRKGEMLTASEARLNHERPKKPSRKKPNT